VAPSFTGVTSFEAYANDVIGRRFEKVKNGRRFENRTPIWGLDVDLRLDVDLSDILLVVFVIIMDVSGEILV